MRSKLIFAVGPSVSWSPDGERLLVVPGAIERRIALVTVPVDGTQRRSRLATGPNAGGVDWQAR